VTVRVLVEAERWSAPADGAAGSRRGENIKVTEAEVVFVAVNAEGRPVPVRPET
jgi:acyl-CoA hydrolase